MDVTVEESAGGGHTVHLVSSRGGGGETHRLSNVHTSINSLNSTTFNSFM